MSLNYLAKSPDTNPMKSLQSMYRVPTIFLGLGGTGCHAVSNINLLYQKTFRDYVEEGQRGIIPAGIQFLGFDSAAGDCPANLISGNEWIHMQGNVTPTSMKVMKSSSYFQSWIPDIDAYEFTNGAGGMRTLGKILFTKNIDRFSRYLGAKMRNARKYSLLDNGTPTIYIFAGLGGGTGSGALLEACFFIRKKYPDAKIFGILGVVGGEEGKPEDIKKNATVGCYAALREINAFQDRYSRSGEYEDGTDFSFPGDNHYGTYSRPFDYIFLVGDQNHRGTGILSDPKSLTAFMGRTAFMLAAYPAEAKDGQRSFESEMCDHLAAADSHVAGALATYLVPGFGQLRLPRELTADYLTLAMGSRVANSIRGGDEYGESSFQKFLVSTNLRLDELSGDIGYGQDGQEILPTSWMNIVKQKMSKPKVRYSASGKKELLGYGRELGSVYLNNLLREMDGKSQSLNETLAGKIHDEFVKCLKDPALRSIGAGNFLELVQAHIVQEQEGVWRKIQSEKMNGLDVIKNDWNAIKRLLNDVCTDSGPIDRVMDKLNLSKAIAQYVEFLEMHQGNVQRWARYEKANNLLIQLSEYIGELATKLKLMSGMLESVSATFISDKAAKAVKLRDVDEASPQDVVRINGFNLLGKEWRRQYLDSDNRSAESLLTTMCAGDWNPSKWFDWLGDNNIHDKICQDICDRIFTADTSDVLKLRIADIFEKTPEEAGDQLSMLLSRHVSPQFKYHEMESLFDQRPIIGFIGNMDDDLGDQYLQDADGLQSLTRAVAYESDTICYLKVATKVALAGCDTLRVQYSSVYNTWREKLRTQSKRSRELQWKQHHGFAGVDAWPDPMDFNLGVDGITEQISRCYAISMMLDPENFRGDAELHEILTAAIDAMHKHASTPKDKRLGLFKLGKSNFWLAPFFDPLKGEKVLSKRSVKPTVDTEIPDRPYRKTGASSKSGSSTKEFTYVFSDVNAPQNISGNLVAAKKAIFESDVHQETVKKWVLWFEENKSSFFSDKQLKEALILATDAAAGMKRRQNQGSAEYELWGAVVKDIGETWREKLL